MGKAQNRRKESQRHSKVTEPTSRKPNKVPLADRIFYLGMSLVLLAYGVSGFFHSKLVVSTSRGGGNRLSFYGAPAWLLASSVVIGAVLMLSVVIDHYDTRNNERYYQAFRRGGLYIGLCLVAAAFVSFFYVNLLG